VHWTNTLFVWLSSSRHIVTAYLPRNSPSVSCRCCTRSIILRKTNYSQQSRHSTSWFTKTCHFIFDYSSHTSWWIFKTLFAPMETKKHTLQFDYLTHDGVVTVSHCKCSFHRVTSCVIIRQ